MGNAGIPKFSKSKQLPYSAIFPISIDLDLSGYGGVFLAEMNSRKCRQDEDVDIRGVLARPETIPEH
jgi:hypothetical protein